MTDSADVLHGTLDLLVLRVLEGEPMHGWGISERIQSLSRDALRVNQGSLYPSLHRLEKKGVLRSSWGTSENNRRARFYQLTTKGRRRLGVEQESWVRFRDAVELVLREA